MTDLLAARAQMGLSLAFHILFAVAGMAMPLLMVLAEGMWLRTKDPGWRALAYRWSKGTAVLFAVGAVSGTVLSFELGLLWPEFMAAAGPVIGMPFSLEGFAFFLEAIFLGIYLYGWERVSPRLHLAAGVGVALSGIASAVFVVAANAWMNTPAGFQSVQTQGGKLVFVGIDPLAAMLNPAFASQALHMVLAAFVAVGFAVAGIHAASLLRAHRSPSAVLFHRRALTLALAMGAVAIPLQFASGDLSAKTVGRTQPVKLAAMEALWETATCAPMTLGGWADEAAERNIGAIEIPCLLSVLTHSDPQAEIQGLKAFPREDRPPVAWVHLAFDLMVGAGSALLAVAGLSAGLTLCRRGLPEDRWFLWMIVAASPLGVLALEAGWMVTELGRQPWVIQGLLRTSEAVTPMPHLVVPFTAFSLLYLGLGAMVLLLLRRIVFAGPRTDSTEEADHAP